MGHWNRHLGNYRPNKRLCLVNRSHSHISSRFMVNRIINWSRIHWINSRNRSISPNILRPINFIKLNHRHIRHIHNRLVTIPLNIRPLNFDILNSHSNIRSHWIHHNCCHSNLFMVVNILGNIHHRLLPHRWSCRYRILGSFKLFIINRSRTMVQIPIIIQPTLGFINSNSHHSCCLHISLVINTQRMGHWNSHWISCCSNLS